MIRNFVHRGNIAHRFTQMVILVAHLALLKWILYTLFEGGTLPFKTLLYHFLGISVAGTLLIRTCAYIYKREYLKEIKEDARSNKLDP